MNKKLAQRFNELKEQLDEIESTKHIADGLYGATTKIDNKLFTGWKIKVKNLLANVCGEKSQHFIAFTKGEPPRLGNKL